MAGHGVALVLSRFGIIVTPHPTQEDDHRAASASDVLKTAARAWNKGKLIGQNPQLRPKRVWSIRTRLQIEERTRDLAMFNLAIHSRPRGCDVVALRVEDIAPSGSAVDRATVDAHHGDH